MENSIKYINIDNLIPGEFQAHFENINDNLENLSNSIKKNGIIVPLVVRETGVEQYEIILGNRRYNAAKKVGLKEIPVIVIEANDEKALDIVISDNVQRRELTAKEEAYLYDKDLEYTNNNEKNLSEKLGIPIDRIISKLGFIRKNNENKKTPPINTNNNQNNISNSSSINQDIINLSELNKEEREDFNMNNDMLNNQNLNTNTNQNNNPQPEAKEPTFGGRFFPSLEDEPTNMNMNQNISAFSNTVSNANDQQPLIDLTDTSTSTNATNDNLNQQNSAPELGNNNQINTIENPNSINTTNDINQPINDTQLNDNYNEQNTMPETNTINNETNNIQQEQPTIPNLDALSSNIVDNNETLPNQQQNITDVPIQNINEQPQEEIINNLEITPSVDNNQNQIDVPQQPNEVINSMPEVSEQQIDPSLNNESLPVSDMPVIEAPINNQEQFPENNINNNEMPAEIESNTEQIIDNENKDIPAFNESTDAPSKDIIPVVNMIKSLAINIENLGYKLNISEDENQSSYTINIEVEK